MTPRPVFTGALPQQTRVSSCTGSTLQSSPDGHLGPKRLEIPILISILFQVIQEGEIKELIVRTGHFSGTSRHAVVGGIRTGEFPKGGLGSAERCSPLALLE